MLLKIRQSTLSKILDQIMKTSFSSSLFFLRALIMENNVGIILGLCVFYSKHNHFNFLFKRK